MLPHWLSTHCSCQLHWLNCLVKPMGTSARIWTCRYLSWCATWTLLCQNQCLSVGILVLAHAKKWIHKILKRHFGIYDCHLLQFLLSYYTLGYGVIKNTTVIVQKLVTITVNICIIASCQQPTKITIAFCTYALQYLSINFKEEKEEVAQGLA